MARRHSRCLIYILYIWSVFIFYNFLLNYTWFSHLNIIIFETQKQKRGHCAGLVVHNSKKWPFGKIPEVASTTTFSSASSVLCVFVCVWVWSSHRQQEKKNRPVLGTFWRQLIKSAASATTSTTTTTYQTLEMQKSMLCCTIHTHTVAYAIWLMLFSVRACVCLLAANDTSLCV